MDSVIAAIIDLSLSYPEHVIAGLIGWAFILLACLMLLWIGPVERPKPNRPVPPRPGLDKGLLAQWYWLAEYGSKEDLEAWEKENLPEDKQSRRR